MTDFSYAQKIMHYPCLIFSVVLLFVEFCILQSKSFNEKNLPVIIWWTELLFPYVEDISEIKCTFGSCISSKKRRYTSKLNPTTYLFYGSDINPEILPLPRRTNDIWALFHEESPLNNYMLSHSPGISLFNFTATFSRYSDFPVTTQFIKDLDYFTERRPVPLDKKNDYRKNGIAPILYLQSHCNVPSDRDTYIKELLKYIKVDSYGQCLHNKDLPETLNTTEAYLNENLFDFISKYKFHIAFENALCDDYMTEKLFRPLYVGSVPIYKGSPTVKDWLPSNTSAVIIDDFPGPKELAEFIYLLDNDDSLYNEYLTFKINGVSNKQFIDTVLKRKWGVNDPDKKDFIQAFECYLCDRIFQINESSIPSVANRKHMNCHQPHPSVIQDQNFNMGPDMEEWIENYWFSYDIANTIQMMIQNGDKNTSKYNKYLMKQRYKQ